MHAVPIASARGKPVAGSTTTVAAGEYPLEREIYLGFPATAAGMLPAPACRFLTYVLGKAGQAQIAGGPMHFMGLTGVQRGVADGQLRHACQVHARIPGAQRSTRPAYFTPTGAIRIVGYNDMRWMLEALDQRFTQSFPDTRPVDPPWNAQRAGSAGQRHQLVRAHGCHNLEVRIGCLPAPNRQ